MNDYALRVNVNVPRVSEMHSCHRHYEHDYARPRENASGCRRGCVDANRHKPLLILQQRLQVHSKIFFSFLSV